MAHTSSPILLLALLYLVLTIGFVVGLVGFQFERQNAEDTAPLYKI